MKQKKGIKDMNRAILIGRLVADPEIRYTQDNMAVGRYRLAVDRRGKDKTADFIGILTFGKSAEFAEKYLHKGMKVCVSGRIQTGSYTKQDGTKVYTTDVVADDQEFCESKQANDAAQNYAPKEDKNGVPEDMQGFMKIPEGQDEELPFV